jgi:hypothetical protein
MTETFCADGTGAGAPDPASDPRLEPAAQAIWAARRREIESWSGILLPDWAEAEPAHRAGTRAMAAAALAAADAVPALAAADAVSGVTGHTGEDSAGRSAGTAG